MKLNPWTAVSLAAAALTLPAIAADWPQYRGPLHDGSSPESIRTNWTTSPPRVLWRRSIAPGWSSIIFSGSRAFTQVRRSSGGSRREFCVALDTTTGNELWAREVDTGTYSDLAGYDNNIDGPRSTPSVDGNFVYVLTSYLKLVCLRADTGAVVWRRDFIAEFPGTNVIEWQNAASPLLVGDLIYLNANVSGNRLTAVRKSDGTTAWRGQNDTMTHATPVFSTLGGVPQVVFLTMSGLVGVDPAAGNVLWRHAFTPSITSTAATPIAVGDVIYASAAYGRGAWTARVRRSGSAFTVTDTHFRQSTSNQNHWASPILHEGFVYSVVERSLRSLGCYDPVNRTNVWTTPTVGTRNPGFASLIKAGGVLVVLTEGGELVLVDPSPTAYRELGRFQALSEYCWNHPALSNGRLYARSSSEIIALDVAPPSVPFPPYTLAISHNPATARLSVAVRNEGDGLLPPDAGSRLTLQSAGDFLGNATPWTEESVVWTGSAGEWTTSLPAPESSRVYRAIEKGGNR
jgi:outer membrane protein assembly factor BamB